MYYTTLVADPPWQYADSLKMKDGVARSSQSQYRTLTLDQIKSFLRDTRLSVIAQQNRMHPDHHAWLFPDRLLFEAIKPNAFLWLWITNPFLLDGSGFDVCRAWGFEPKALITWTKGRIADGQIIERPGMGRYTRGVTEHLILATRGKVGDLVQSRSVTNWFLAPRGKHSEKPDEAYRRIKRVTPGPYLALFERTYREGFDVVGDELPEAPRVVDHAAA